MQVQDAADSSFDYSYTFLSQVLAPCTKRLINCENNKSIGIAFH